MTFHETKRKEEPFTSSCLYCLLGYYLCVNLAALWTAASDPLFTLVISNESDEGGAVLSKRWYGETVKIISEKFPWWFGTKHKTYGDNTDASHIDGHILLSLLAPRPLYVVSAEGDTWSDPKGEFFKCQRSRTGLLPVWKGRNWRSHNAPLQHPVGGTVRYHIRAGWHDVTLYDWQQYLGFAHEQWK